MNDDELVFSGEHGLLARGWRQPASNRSWDSGSRFSGEMPSSPLDAGCAARNAFGYQPNANGLTARAPLTNE